jgi:hypothetical protein
MGSGLEFLLKRNLSYVLTEESLRRVGDSI